MKIKRITLAVSLALADVCLASTSPKSAAPEKKICAAAVYRDPIGSFPVSRAPGTSLCTFRYRARDWVNTRGVCIHSTDGSWSVRYERNKGSADDPRKVLKHKLCIPDPVRPVDMEVILIPFVWMEYLLIYMSGESRFMLVGSTSMDLLRLMALYANPPIDDYEALKAMEASLGYDVAKHERVSQSGN